MKAQMQRTQEHKEYPVPMSTYVARIEKLSHEQQIYLDGFLTGAIERERLQREAEKHEAPKA